MAKYRVGCSGFLYDSWRGAFYPESLAQKRWLSFYVGKFDTVELNVTFYRLLKKEAFERWHNETPPNFAFILKGSRFITHIKKLRDVELPLLTFFNTTAPLLEKLEVVLWQLPPNFKINLKNLEDFIEALKPYPVRHVFEFRHKSWINKRVYKLLSASNIAICMADWPEFINDLPLTADFVYIRRHGEYGSYAKDYSSDQLKKDAKKIKSYLGLGKDVYIYFNNDAMGYAPKNAMMLRAMLEGTVSKRAKKKKPSKKSKAGKTRPKKAKPARKVKPKKIKGKKFSSKKITRKTKKKKSVRKLKTGRVKTRKALKKRTAKKPLKRKPAKKTLKRKIPKKPVRKKSPRKTKITKRKKR